MKKIIEIYKKNEELINYLIIGVLTTLINYISYCFCVFTFLNSNIAWQLQLANFISWVVAVAFAYITNRKIVFKSKNKNIYEECLKFVSARVLTLLVDMLIMYVTVTIFGLNDLIMKIASNIIIIILNYVLSKIIVFKQKG